MNAPLTPPAASLENLAQIQACEERIINAWPAPSTLVLGDWVLRFANGYSGRANSAAPQRAGAELDAAMLDLIEQLYTQAGLPPCLRLTPLAAAGGREQIAARGYAVRDTSIGMIAPLASIGEHVDASLRISPAATPEWIAGVCAHQTGAKRNAAHLAAIVGGIRLPAAFATLEQDGRPEAFAMSVSDRGMAEIGSVVVSAHQRGKGLGRRLMQGLMAWAAMQGCHSAFLQVESGNSAAVSLYASLGFEALYTYETWAKDQI
jgi:N-acetylglutamate synthase